MLSAFLIKLFNMSIAAGFVVLAVVLARLVLKRAPKWLRCALWVLVAVRLIIPTLPQSTVSLVPSAETIVIRQTEQSVGQKQNGNVGVQQDPALNDPDLTSSSGTREIDRGPYEAKNERRSWVVADVERIDPGYGRPHLCAKPRETDHGITDHYDQPAQPEISCNIQE